jgi:hypothetical protein
MNNIYWTHSTESGLCDRLIDLTLMSTYAKIKKSNLYLNWKIVHSGQKYLWDINDGITKEWDEVRYRDYLYENLKQYLNLPDNIHIGQGTYNEIFPYYLGGVHSPYSFYMQFLKNKVTIEEFVNTYFSVISEFSPTEKLNKLIEDVTIPNLSVHLRRRDKIRMDTDGGSLHPKELDDLNKMTILFIDNFISKNKNTKIFFCSDDEDVLNMFTEKYSNNVIKPPSFNNTIEKTYFDIILLSKSSNILMSQKHSNFSLFSSLLGKTNLYYLYEDCMLTRNGFNHLPFIKHYTEL